MSTKPLFRPETVKNLPDTPEMHAAMEELERDPPCMMPWKHILVNQNGCVGVCCLSRWNLGNLNETSLEEIWNSEKMQELREAMLKHDYTTCSIRCAFIMDRIKAGKPCKLPK